MGPQGKTFTISNIHNFLLHRDLQFMPTSLDWTLAVTVLAN